MERQQDGTGRRSWGIRKGEEKKGGEGGNKRGGKGESDGRKTNTHQVIRVDLKKKKKTCHVFSPDRDEL